MVVVAFCIVSLFTPYSVHAAPAISALENSGQCAQPPANTNPENLTDSELVLYGLPLHREGENHSEWKRLANSVKHHSCTVQHTAYSNAFQTWGGYVAQSETYTFVSAYWNVPCVVPGSQTGVSSHWVGIGGYGNNNLVQTGTHSETWYFLGFQQYSYYAWVQNYAYNTTETQVFNVNCGDSMYAEVSRGNHMFIEDITTGTSSGDKAFGPNANTSSAECIAERPGGGSSTLADFNNVNFRNCDVNSLGHGIGQGNPSKIEVTNNNKALTSTGSISNNSQNFTITWKAYS